MELAHFMKDVEKLQAHEANVMNAEWQECLAAQRSRKEQAWSLDNNLPSVQEVAQVVENRPSPQPAAPRATRHALRRLIEKVVSGTANKVLRADEVDKRRLAFQTAWERWRVWNEEEATATSTSSRSQNISPSCDVNMMKLTSRRNSEYLGLGYGTSMKQYENIRYANSDYFNGLRASATSSSKRREAERLLHETELQKDAQDLALAVQRRPHLDSKVVKFEEMKAIVDSGSTVNLSDLAGGTVLYDYELDAKIRVKAFNNSSSREQGRGTIIGWGTDVQGLRVPFSCTASAPTRRHTVNLLSVSSQAAMENESHFYYAVKLDEDSRWT